MSEHGGHGHGSMRVLVGSSCSDSTETCLVHIYTWMVVDHKPPPIDKLLDLDARHRGMGEMGKSYCHAVTDMAGKVH